MQYANVIKNRCITQKIFETGTVHAREFVVPVQDMAFLNGLPVYRVHRDYPNLYANDNR